MTFDEYTQQYFEGIPPLPAHILASYRSFYAAGQEAASLQSPRYMTMRHIETVRNYLNQCIRELLNRQEAHDQSKLESPEVEAFDAITHGLRGLTYGSEAYRQILKANQPAIEHHYQHNRHHPEWHQEGIRGMSLIDLLEMLCDWKAATLRHADGDIRKSIALNKERFGYGEELERIFHNTIDWLEQSPVYHKAQES